MNNFHFRHVAVVSASLLLLLTAASADQKAGSMSLYGIAIGGVYNIPACPPYDGRTLGVPFTCSQVVRGNKKPVLFSATERPNGLVPNHSLNADISVSTSQSATGEVVVTHLHFGVQSSAIAEFKRKFGEPSTSQSDKTNSSGAKWSQVSYEWTTGDLTSDKPQ